MGLNHNSANAFEHKENNELELMNGVKEFKEH